MRRRAARAAGLVLVLSGLVACAGPRSAAGGRSPAEGWAILMVVRDEANRVARYRLDDRGVLHFGGGVDAMRGRESWSDRLRDDEAAELVGLLERVGWLRSAPRGAGGRWPRRDVEIEGPEGRRSFTIEGADPDAEAVEAALARIAARRHEPFLDAFPKPDVERP